VIDGEKYLGRLKGAFVSHLFSYQNSQKIKASMNPQWSTSLSNSLHLTQHPKGCVAGSNLFLFTASFDDRSQSKISLPKSLPPKLKLYH
jgi:hypothetical protein